MYLQFTPDLRISRLINGLWQLSGAHGRINPQAALAAMHDYHRAGLTTWDLADHYGPAEDVIGEFRVALGDRKDEIQAFTKWVPRPGPMNRPVVEQALRMSRQRMQMKPLDLVQFHWWEYRDDRYLDALKHMADLRDAGWLRHVALTNFDTAHLATIQDAGVAIVSNQVQYSLVDRRPQVRMAPHCETSGVWLLPYGVLAGGLLSDRYLDRPEPGRRELDTASLGKYKRMIDAWGGWAPFQTLLHTLRNVADRHEASIANVAARWVLEQPQVAGVIIGARLGLSDNFRENLRIFDFELTPTDRAEIEAILPPADDLYDAIGDCGDEYRR
jgi:aryl-alcohol dehydrogenase-like predicted oxidoreductase